MNTSDVKKFLLPVITNFGSNRYFEIINISDKDNSELILFQNMWYGSTFEITSVDGDDTVYDNQVVNIVGTGFGTVQGLVFIDGVQQSINSWSDTLINITVEQGALSLGANTLKVFKPI